LTATKKGSEVGDATHRKPESTEARNTAKTRPAGHQQDRSSAGTQTPVCADQEAQSEQRQSPTGAAVTTRETLQTHPRRYST